VNTPPMICQAGRQAGGQVGRQAGGQGPGSCRDAVAPSAAACCCWVLLLLLCCPRAFYVLLPLSAVSSASAVATGSLHQRPLPAVSLYHSHGACCAPHTHRTRRGQKVIPRPLLLTNHDLRGGCVVRVVLNGVLKEVVGGSGAAAPLQHVAHIPRPPPPLPHYGESVALTPSTQL
jgi:hypothetical protein